MIALNSGRYLTPEEYLEFEKTSEIRHEYIDGEIYAMAGASNAHNIINTNLLVNLRLKLKDTACRAYINDMKVRVADGQRFFYPDMLVSCASETKDLTSYYMEQPRLIIEVLSKSTEGFDRGDKFKFYRSIPSLEEYVLVSSDQYSVDYFRRGENDFWLLQSYQELDATLQLKSIDVEISLTEIYETILFETTLEEASEK
ncbi:protein of unknown function DUF820 [[Leptolyngbya] sp. PCC 7376]|uniref:Uma2 family endonuclease n=1 Tax=[Leptolyngbya] sp. PCC 7376 TaxID=111781 RepID=UPI00029EEC58|nr:Uma2 family endonuclease [[Leptolyngbya] sp. PCC 7376]AFY36647.1 protein of unknown function DUF820 [[Leptolyngbya] sp. PCC 7376]